MPVDESSGEERREERLQSSHHPCPRLGFLQDQNHPSIQFAFNIVIYSKAKERKKHEIPKDLGFKGTPNA